MKQTTGLTQDRQEVAQTAAGIGIETGNCRRCGRPYFMESGDRGLCCVCEGRETTEHADRGLRDNRLALNLDKGGDK